MCQFVGIGLQTALDDIFHYDLEILYMEFILFFMVFLIDLDFEIFLVKLNSQKIVLKKNWFFSKVAPLISSVHIF